MIAKTKTVRGLSENTRTKSFPGGHSRPKIVIRLAVFFLGALFSIDGFAECMIDEPNYEPGSGAADILCTDPPGSSVTINLQKLGVWIDTSTSVDVDRYSGPSNGSATSNPDIPHIMVYSPSDSSGTSDSFDYILFDSNQEGSSTATVTINFDGGITQKPGAAAFSSALETICNGPSPSIPEVCAEYSDLANNPSELSKLIKALSPSYVMAMGRMSARMVKNQIGNVRKRITELRFGAKGFTMQNVSLELGGQKLAGAQLQQILAGQQTGGAAGAGQKRFGGKLGGFLSGNYGAGNRDETDNEDGFDFSSNGLTVGVDYRRSQKLMYGGALGYASTGTDLSQNDGGYDISGNNLSLYGTFFHTQQIYIDGVFLYSDQDFEATRNINYGSINQSASSDTSGSLLALSVEGGYEVATRNGLTATAITKLDYIKSSLDGYQESGAGAYNLSIEGRDFTEINSSVGVQLVMARSYGWGVLLPQFDLKWVHKFKDDSNGVEGTFVNDSTGTVFKTNTDAVDQDYFNLGLGVSAIMPGGKTGYIQYEQVLGKDYYTDYSLSLGIRGEF